MAYLIIFLVHSFSTSLLLLNRFTSTSLSVVRVFNRIIFFFLLLSSMASIHLQTFHPVKSDLLLSEESLQILRSSVWNSSKQPCAHRIRVLLLIDIELNVL